jgi:hypothetical protein
MEEIYNSAIIDRETYINKTKHIQTLKQLINSKEKINNFIIQDVKRKAEYLDKMTNNIQNTILYNSSKNDDISKKDLMKCTFIIPFKKDFPERLINLMCLLNFIGKHFNTKILVFEQGTKCSFDELVIKYSTNMDYYFLESSEPFSRTIVSNYLIERATSEILVINDTDCFTYPEAYEITQNKLINDGFKLLHPFGTPPGSFEISDKASFMEDYDIKCLKITSKPNIAGVGGILFINRELYKLLGNENINFISYSPEDIERVKRIRKLGFKSSESYNEKAAGPNNKYLNTPLFHLSHPRTEESTIIHKYYVSNELLNFCLESMSNDELIEYLYKYSNYLGTLQEYINKINSYK